MKRHPAEDNSGRLPTTLLHPGDSPLSKFRTRLCRVSTCCKAHIVMRPDTLIQQPLDPRSALCIGWLDSAPFLHIASWRLLGKFANGAVGYVVALLVYCSQRYDVVCLKQGARTEGTSSSHTRLRSSSSSGLRPRPGPQDQSS